jgi:hypothetical protein
MVKDSEIGNIATIGPAGHPPCSKYGRPRVRVCLV